MDKCDKVGKLAIPLSDVNNVYLFLLGGTFVNNFNLFGRQYKSYAGLMLRTGWSTCGCTTILCPGPEGLACIHRNYHADRGYQRTEYTNHFNIYRAAEIGGSPAPGYSSGQ